MERERKGLRVGCIHSLEGAEKATSSHSNKQDTVQYGVICQRGNSCTRTCERTLTAIAIKITPRIWEKLSPSCRFSIWPRSRGDSLGPSSDDSVEKDGEGV